MAALRDRVATEGLWRWTWQTPTEHGVSWHLPPLYRQAHVMYLPYLLYLLVVPAVYRHLWPPSFNVRREEPTKQTRSREKNTGMGTRKGASGSKGRAGGTECTQRNARGRKETSHSGLWGGSAARNGWLIDSCRFVSIRVKPARVAHLASLSLFYSLQPLQPLLDAPHTQNR